MKIQGKLSADIVALHCKRNNANDGMEAQVDIDVGIEQETAGEIYGADFAKLAFGAMTILDDAETGKSIGWLQDKIKPGSALVCEHHEIKLAGLKVRCQPQVLSITPVEKKPSGVVRIRLEVESQNAATLLDKVGSTLKADFSPAQGEFTFDAAKARGKKKATPDDGDEVGAEP